MLKKIISTIDEYNMTDKTDVIFVGVSGGADSICLLHVLNALAPRYGYSLKAIHVEHGIRGQESLEDAKFVESFCRTNGIAFKMHSVKAVEYAMEHSLSIEEAARHLRYEAFSQEVERATKVGLNARIAVAHHREDVAETVLFNMTRGSGLNGLCSIKPVNNDIIRPLIRISRAEIESYLEEKGISYCTDSTNEDMSYSRNRIRARVLPELNKINFRATDHILSLSKIINDASVYIDGQVEAVMKKYVSMTSKNGVACHTLSRDILSEDDYIVTEAIHKWLGDAASAMKDISSVHIESVKDLLQADCGKKLSMPYGLIITSEADRIVAYKGGPGSGVDTNALISLEEIERAGQITVSAGDRQVKFVLQKIDETFDLSYADNEKCFDFDKIENDLTLRNRRTGDFLTVDSQLSRKSLKDYFINEKIPSDERDSIPLLCDGNHVMWIFGKRISEAYKLNASTTRCLRVIY